MTRNEYSYPVIINKQVRMTASESPAHSGRLQHAVDFITVEETPIYATCDGTVVDIKQDSTQGGPQQEFDELGNYIEIAHQNGEYSIYEHIRHNGSVVKVGELVNQGQLIGYSGATGWLAHLGPHIHFDVHRYFGKGPHDYETLEIRWRTL